MVTNTLKRDLGVLDAVLLGLGSILGTGIFVSIGLGAGIAGGFVVVAIVTAAMVATLNALSSAQLAAAHPVSGGTYEYGYHFLHPIFGFMAGWMFVVAKSASAATAALGFAGYLLAFLGYSRGAIVWVAVAVVILVTIVVLAGARRSNHMNSLVVGFTLFALVCFTAAGFWYGWAGSGAAHGETLSAVRVTPAALLHASALMFVAYAGYGRIATMAEEVRDPRRTIPRAIIATLSVSALLYILVSWAGVRAVGAEFLAQATEGRAAPLEVAAQEFGVPFLPAIVAIGAATAMLGVLLNLVLGLSRVYLAMGRRRDMPVLLARVDAHGRTPWPAVLVTGAVILMLALIGSVKTTWSFSAFTVLVYYAITNLAALRIPEADRLFPRWIPAGGLIACLGLAFWVEPPVWLTGLVIGGIGLVWFAIAGGVKRAGGGA
ncbi:MAG: APC family permease [Verrucomicrobiota bacterium]